MHRTWTSRRAILMHLTLIFFLPQFAALTWWQCHRAMSGNTLSWAYTFEWPLFAGYAVFMWWKLVHDPPGMGKVATVPADGDPSVVEGSAEVGELVGASAGRSLSAGSTAPGGPAGSAAPGDPATVEGEDVDEELASYNRYLAGLNASGKRKQW